ncbi:c-type cytochrome biogenesis protein CcsB [Xylanimonas allomyrinae]|uniref:C-type cytochrome biogenesis protein CcsB n=1 Tax=Xylanimonas allomyrinae TaxID=2509459 RepID=A0A4P6EN51_9MICO|nr:c-type cytochrome biogenesis protein CcsB [Xylanimonas allomyrinae]QAY64320.1 c-type cytochrome biogenesis protein CcsB [Xylanimonas allomyrinae]
MTTAELSTLLVWAAATALAIAMVAFAVDLARRTEARADARATARELAAVGAAAPRGAGAPATAGAAEAVVAARRAAGIAMSTTWLGAALLLAGIVLRGVAAGRTPWANMYEFTLTGSFVALAVFLAVSTRRDVRFLGAFVTGLATLFLVLGLNVFYVAATGVMPALRSYWLVIHVGVAITASGVFTVAFVASVLQLLRTARDGGAGWAAGWRWLDRVPAPVSLEALSFRLNAVGFVLWTFTIIGGAIWAEHAWGRYWGWDPKEVWSFVIWVVYAAYLHARTTRGWSGSRAAWFVVVGYACVLFNFTGVNLVFNGLHSYSGLKS